MFRNFNSNDADRIAHSLTCTVLAAAFARIRHTARRKNTVHFESRITQILIKGDFDRSHIYFVTQPPFDFIGGDGLEEQDKCFSQLVARFRDGVSLAGYTHLSLPGNESVNFAFDYRAEAHIRVVVSSYLPSEHPSGAFLSAPTEIGGCVCVLSILNLMR